jgi:hypothetical protein
MSTPLPTSSTRFTPEQREILGQVYTLILSWRRERKKLESNSQADKSTTSISAAMLPSLTQNDGGRHE